MPTSLPPRPQIPDLAHMSLELATPRLALRPLEPRHAEELFVHAADPDVAKTMSWTAHADLSVTRSFVDAMIAARERGSELVWAIERDGIAIGAVTLGRITWEFRAWRRDVAELGYWIGKPFWGQGLTSEAARAATAFGFETLGLHKITVGCVDGNEASKRIIEKLGFRFLAVHEDDFWRDGRWQNHLRFEQTVSEWLDSGGEWIDSTRTLRFSKPPRS